MCMEAILFNGAEPFELFTIVNMYIAQDKGG